MLFEKEYRCWQIEEIITHLTKLKNNKAAGADGISGKFLKYVSDDLAPIYSIFLGLLFYM